MRLLLASIVVSLVAIASGAQSTAQKTAATGVPNLKDSLKFAAIGDNGTGDKPQYEVAAEMSAWYRRFPFELVIMLGDNIYGGQRPKDFVDKVENPYKPLLDAGVKFYAALGNHDNQANRFYKPWNMNGERYYTFKRGDTQFYALDSTYMDAKQLAWFEKNLQSASTPWKISFFHHPLYNDGKMHGPDMDLRSRLVPFFQLYGMNAVFSGHEHAYERALMTWPDAEEQAELAGGTDTDARTGRSC
jgi:3',5'-cyclic AMP phosphodiesterase CpdA